MIMKKHGPSFYLMMKHVLYLGNYSKLITCDEKLKIESFSLFLILECFDSDQILLNLKMLDYSTCAVSIRYYI